MDISPKRQIIDEVFLNTDYHIDFYQREYKWTSEPVLRLLGDLFFVFNQEYSQDLEPSKEMIEEKYSWYYLNTYLTNKIKVGDKADDKVYVVDGQQRLTTLTILLIKLHNKSKEFCLEPEFSYWIRCKIAGSDGGKISYWMKHEKSLDVLKDLFENKKDREEIDTSSSITSKNMVNNYIEIDKYIDDQLFCEHRFRTFVFFVLRRLILINLSVEQAKAPMVFEVINDRGVRLRPYEILKGKLLGQIDKSELKKFDELWDSIVKEFKEDEVDIFFRRYLKAKYANTRKEGTVFDSDYHRKMLSSKMNKNLGLNHDPTKVKRFLDGTFKYYSSLYIKILNAYAEENKKFPSVYINKLNKMDSHFLLILSACKLNDPQEDKKIEKAAYEYDRLFVLLQLQNSYDSNSFYEFLYKISEEIRDKDLDGFRKIFDKYLFLQLEQRRNSEVKEAFQYGFFRNTGTNLNLRFKRYYFARIEQFFGMNPGFRMRHKMDHLVSKTGSGDGFHIEHILSHNEENKALFDNNDDLFEEERNRLGGILLLKGKDNISSNNEPYSEKLKTYAGTLHWNETLREDFYKSNLDMKKLKEKFNLDLNAMNKFGKEELEKRQKLLFDISKHIWK